MVKSLRPSPLSRTLALVPPAVALVAQQASGAFDTYLKIGDVKGEATDAKHSEWIAASSFQFGAGIGITRTGTDVSFGKPSVSELVITKKLDRSSPELFLGCVTGKRHTTVILELQRSGTYSPFYRITLSDVLVSGISNSGASGGDDKPAESVSLNFAKIKIEYFVQDAKGGTIEAVPAVTWDTTTNSKG